MRRVLVVVLLAGLLVPGTAGAQMPPPVQVVFTWCPWAQTRPGCTSPGTHVVYWGDGDPFTLLHEMGHQLDYWVMTDADRNGFRAIMHDKRPWRASGGDSPHERFAEAYAWCALYPRALPDGDGPAYSFRPKPKTYRKVCALVRSIIRRLPVR